MAVRELAANGLRVLVRDGAISNEMWESWRANVAVGADVRRVLLDATTADLTALDRAAFFGTVDRYDTLPPRGTPMAAVIDSGWRLARQYEAYMQDKGLDVIVFNHLDVAATWLRVDLAQARQVIAELQAEIRAR